MRDYRGLIMSQPSQYTCDKNGMHERHCYKIKFYVYSYVEIRIKGTIVIVSSPRPSGLFSPGFRLSIGDYKHSLRKDLAMVSCTCLYIPFLFTKCRDCSLMINCSQEVSIKYTRHRDHVQYQVESVYERHVSMPYCYLHWHSVYMQLHQLAS